MTQRCLITWLLPTLLLIGWTVGGCSPQQQRQSSPVRVEVSIQQMKFTPSEVEVHAGDTIVFTNNDLVVHDVSEETEKAWTSGPIPVGDSFVLVVEEEAAYYCSLHPIMKGKITLAAP